MQPLELPQSAVAMTTAAAMSPNQSYGWKMYNNHCNSYCSSSSTHTTSTVSPHCYNVNTSFYGNNVNSNHTANSSTNNDHYYAQYAQTPSASSAFAPSAAAHNNVIMDPYAYSQLQYQLQFEQLLLQQQAQQSQQAVSAAHSASQHPLQSVAPTRAMAAQPVTRASSNALQSEQEKDKMDETALAQQQTCIEKIYLNGKFVTPAVFEHLSTELASMSAHEVYEGFFVSSQQTGNEWDLVLKIFYHNDKENKTYIKYYLVHQEYVLHSERCSDLFIDECLQNGDCVCIELELPLCLFNEFDHVINYVYGGDIFIGDSHLIPLYVLMDKLKINGGILGELYREIRKFCDKYRCVPYLLKSEELNNEELIWLCGDAILQNLSFITYSEWLLIPLTAFHRLIFQAVAGGVGGKYSDFIVCELIIQYVKSIMSESHEKGKEIIKYLETTDICSVSLDHALPLLKICDVLFSNRSYEWRLQNVTIYRLSVYKIATEFTPYHNSLCQQLQGLSPITFSNILVIAKHLPENALNLSLMAYKEGNHAAYFNDKRLRISNILKQRNEQNDSEKQRSSKSANRVYADTNHQNERTAMDAMEGDDVDDDDDTLIMMKTMAMNQQQESCSNSSSDPVIISPLEISNTASNCSRSPGKTMEQYDYSRSPAYSANSENNTSQNMWTPYMEDASNKHDDQHMYDSPLTKRSQFNMSVNALISRLTNE